MCKVYVEANLQIHFKWFYMLISKLHVETSKAHYTQTIYVGNTLINNDLFILNIVWNFKQALKFKTTMKVDSSLQMKW